MVNDNQGRGNSSGPNNAGQQGQDGANANDGHQQRQDGHGNAGRAADGNNDQIHTLYMVTAQSLLIISAFSDQLLWLHLLQTCFLQQHVYNATMNSALEIDWVMRALNNEEMSA